MKFNGERPSGFPGPPGSQGFPGQPPGMYPGVSPGGSIRNTLGSGLKSKGVFQKDGQINNLRGGFIGRKGVPGMGSQPAGPEQMNALPSVTPSLGTGKPSGGSSMGSGPFSFLGNDVGPGFSQPRQLILQAAQQGITANGIANISADNSFLVVANLPPPNSFAGYGYGSYAVYLVDNKGKSGFLAGILRPMGNGVYQTQFRSQVPLIHYDKVVISLENPQAIGQAPKGPIILKVKEPGGAIAFLAPIKKAGGSVWGKFTGLFRKKPKTPEVPEGGSLPAEEPIPPLQTAYPAGNQGLPPVNQQMPLQGVPQVPQQSIQPGAQQWNQPVNQQVYPPGAQQGIPGQFQAGPGNPMIPQ